MKTNWNPATLHGVASDASCINAYRKIGSSLKMPAMPLTVFHVEENGGEN